MASCNELGLAPEECIACEDAPNGVMSAYRAGLKVIMIPDQSPVTDDLRPMLYRDVDSLDQIIDILEKEGKLDG